MDKRIRVILISLALFSLFYWIAGIQKNFHVDEFYSWVYAERSTYKEILFLKDTGIGHPPLFHFIQKSVQEFLPYQAVFSVRLANYFIGLGSIIVLISLLSQNSFHPFLYYGLSMSAGLLNTFVFSRMWGLTFFFAALLIYSGEKFSKTGEPRRLIFFYVVALLGFLSDYSFILLLPYIFWITFLKNRRIKLWLYLLFSALLLVRIASGFFEIHRNDISLSDFIYKQFIGLEELIYQSGIALFNFWFKEPFLAAALIILIFLCISVGRKLMKNIPVSFTEKLWVYFLFLLTIEIVLRLGLMKTIFVLPFFIFIGGMVVVGAYQRRSEILSSDFRLILSAAAGVFILLWVNDHFWRQVIEARFLTVLLPVFLLLLVRTSNSKLLFTMSSVFVVSGLMYAFSSGLSDNYPAPRITEKLPVVYQDAYAYSTQYFYSSPADNPFIADFTPFDKDCRVCKMGREDIPFEMFDTLLVVWRSNSDPSKRLPGSFTLVSKEDRSLSTLDRFQFYHFQPIYSRRYSVYTFVNKSRLEHSEY